MQPRDERDALAGPGRTDNDRERDLRTCIERRMQPRSHYVPTRKPRRRELRRGQRSLSQDPHPSFTIHPLSGDSRSPHHTAYSEDRG